MLAQFVEDFVHLEGGGQGLDQHRRLERSAGNAERLLREAENVVPQPRLEMALQLRQVEGGRRALLDLRPGAMEDIEAEVEQRPRNLVAVDRHVALGEMPAARAHHQQRRIGFKRVALAGGRVDEIDPARPAVAQVDLAVDQVGEDRRGRVLEIGHEDFRA